ncbi:HNH endonuclease [Agrobacterium rosae]|uniref:HNH endonuclease n=1 Tax=Agrobacterium rosae TaxID=1972867 RepID=UPI003BA1F874
MSAEALYISSGESAELYSIAPTDGISGHVSTIEMERVYKRTFVRSARTRQIYADLRSAPENDICPLCSQRTVSQLDHYLPQSAHPTLTVTPMNLVPACAECNKTKLAQEAADASCQTFHPYFEDADDARWLYAEVLEVAPAALVFSARPPEVWDEVKRDRINSHFKTYELGELYASHAAVELGDIRFGLQQMAQDSSVERISQHLREAALSRAMAHENSWRRATYEALADSDWYCRGGFN